MTGSTAGAGGLEIAKNACMSTVLIRMLYASSLNVRLLVRLFLGAMAVRKIGTDPYQCTHHAHLRGKTSSHSHLSRRRFHESGVTCAPLSSPVRSLESVCPQDFGYPCLDFSAIALALPWPADSTEHTPLSPDDQRCELFMVSDLG